MGVGVAEQPGFGRAPDAAVFGTNRQRKDARAERAVLGAVSAPLGAVEDGNAVVEGASPDAPGLVADECISVVVAEAVSVV